MALLLTPIYLCVLCFHHYTSPTGLLNMQYTGCYRGYSCISTSQTYHTHSMCGESSWFNELCHSICWRRIGPRSASLLPILIKNKESADKIGWLINRSGPCTYPWAGAKNGPGTIVLLPKLFQLVQNENKQKSLGSSGVKGLWFCPVRALKSLRCLSTLSSSQVKSSEFNIHLHLDIYLTLSSREIIRYLIHPPELYPPLIKGWEMRVSLWLWTSRAACRSDSRFPTVSFSKRPSTAKPLFCCGPSPGTNGIAGPEIWGELFKLGHLENIPVYNHSFS